MSTLRAEALRLFRAGRVLEAEQACQLRLETEPDDVEALKVVAVAALRRGDAQRAIVKLTHATKIDPADTIARYHLARAHELGGNVVAALAWYDTALQLAPEFHVARLNYGAALERAGEPDRALWQWARALRDAQSQGRWLDAATTPSGLQATVERAAAAVRSRRRELLFGALEPLESRYGRDALERVARCLRVYLQEEPPLYSDPQQQPTFLYFPDLPPAPLLDRALFDWIAALEADTGAIRAELEALLPSTAGRERVFDSAALERDNLRGAHGAPGWNGYYFYRHGERRDENCVRCPVTARALDALPLSHVPEHGPEVLFSVFAPGTHLLPHRGVTNTRLVAHLPLIVPADCALRVGGELHAWREGKVVVFDDTYEHEAWNRSDRTRVVLIFDVWNPYLTAAERAALTDLVGAIGSFRSRVESA